MAPERPTAPDVQLRPRGHVAGHGKVDVFTRALARRAPLRRAAAADAIAMQSARWEAAANPDSIGHLRREVASFASHAGMADSGVADLQVAVSEALTNVVMHAYCDREPDGGVRVDAEVGDRELLVRVRDYGRGLEPRLNSPGMGLGLPIIATLCKRHSIRRCDDGGTEVGMCFDLLRDDQAPRANASTAQ